VAPTPPVGLPFFSCGTYVFPVLVVFVNLRKARLRLDLHDAAWLSFPPEVMLIDVICPSELSHHVPNIGAFG